MSHRSITISFIVAGIAMLSLPTHAETQTPKPAKTIADYNNQLTDCLNTQMPSYAPWHAGLWLDDSLTMKMLPTYKVWRKKLNLTTSCNTADASCITGFYGYARQFIRSSDHMFPLKMLGNNTFVEHELLYTSEKASRHTLHTFFPILFQGISRSFVRSKISDRDNMVFEQCRSAFGGTGYAECLESSYAQALRPFQKDKERTYFDSYWKIYQDHSNVAFRRVARSWPFQPTTAYDLNERGKLKAVFPTYKEFRHPDMLVWGKSENGRYQVSIGTDKETSDQKKQHDMVLSRASRAMSCFEPVINELGVK